MVGEEEEEDGRLRLAYDNVVRRAKQRRKQSIAMEVLKKAVFRRLSNSPDHKNLSADRRELIEARLCALLPQLLDHTPNHPPYAEMIQRAIERLEEDCGSTEESISTYIRSTYADLPWAHSHLLPHHLRKLTEAGEIIATPNSRYSLALANPSSSPEQHQQCHDNDNANDALPGATVSTEPTRKPRKERSQRRQRTKRGRGNRIKKPSSEQQENPPEVETDLNQSSLPPQQRQRCGLSRKRGRGQQKEPGEAIRTKHYFDGEGSTVHPSEPPDVGSGEKALEMEASFEKHPRQKLRVRWSLRGQKQPEEAIGTETNSFMIQTVEESFPLLHSSGSPGEPLNQPEAVRTVAGDAGNNDSTSIVSCSETTRAAVGNTGASVNNDEVPLQIVLPQSSRGQMKQAEARTTASDAYDSLTVLSSGPIVAAMEAKDKRASDSLGEDGKPFQTPQQVLPSSHGYEELNHPESGSFTTDVCNDGSIVLSPVNPAVEEKKASVTEARQILPQRHSCAIVYERQKHPEVGSAASVANNNNSMVLSIGPLPVVEYAVDEKEKPNEQPPQEQQLSLQPADDDDDVIVEFSWNPKFLKKEKEGKPNKKSEPRRRYSLRLAEQCKQGEEAQTKPLTGAVLALAVVKREKETSEIEAEGKEKEKQPLEQQQKPNKKAKHVKKDRKESGTHTELSQQQQKKLQPKHQREEQKESGTTTKLSQQKQQPKRHREEQKESGKEMEPSQKKKRDKYGKEEPKEMGTEPELSQQQLQLQQRKQLGKSKKELQLQQKQQIPKGQGKQGRLPNGPKLQQKQQAPKGQEKRGRPRNGPGLQLKQQAPKGQERRGRPRKVPALQQKQRGSEGQDERKSNQLGKKITPLSLSAAAGVGDVQSSKSQMAEMDQEPSEPQKKTRGRGRPPKKKEMPVETTVKVQG